MDKYQEYMLKGYTNTKIYYILNERNENCFDGNEIKIQQDEDITKTIYKLYISNRATIETIYAVKKGEQEAFEQSEEEYSIFSCVLDFNNRIDSIKIKFKHNLAEDLIIPVIFYEADKEKYYAKKEQERKDNLLKTASVKVETGRELVNIYFQPCCEEYARTEILLYKYNMFLGKYKVEEEFFFKTITGLTDGDYEFVLKQMNSNGDIIMETNKMTFYLGIKMSSLR